MKTLLVILASIEYGLKRFRSKHEIPNRIPPRRPGFSPRSANQKMHLGKVSSTLSK